MEHPDSSELKATPSEKKTFYLTVSDSFRTGAIQAISLEAYA